MTTLIAMDVAVKRAKKTRPRNGQMYKVW